MQAANKGTAITLVIVDEHGDQVDLTSYPTRNIIFKSPTATVTSKVATLVNDGTDGEMEFVTTATFPIEIGEWQIQAQISNATESFRSTISTFTVEGNLS